MINFFRKVRQRLLVENHFSKYLLYAMGEIFLVVVGILIALQINNWNELRLQKEKEVVLLTEIISDLNYNETNAQRALESSNKIELDSILQTFDNVINHLEKKLPYDTSLARPFYSLHQCPSMNIKSSGFESLKSSGMDIIQNDSLRSDVGEYYTVTVQHTEDVYTELRDDFYNYILKFPRTLFRTKKDQNQRMIQIPVDYDQLLENVEYIESLKMFKSIYENNLAGTYWYLDETQSLKEELETYLKTN